jgi:hypothetical protein
MTTKRMFRVSIEDPKKTGGVRVHLPIHRNEEEVTKLRAAYANVIAHAVEDTRAPAEPDDRPPGFRKALTALIECYRQAEREGRPELAERAQDAVAALLGYQRHLRPDEGKAFGEEAGEGQPRITLTGVGS